MDIIEKQIKECENLVSGLNNIIKRIDDEKDKEYMRQCIEKVGVLKQCLERASKL